MKGKVKVVVVLLERAVGEPSRYRVSRGAPVTA
jgi:hypothetical protein